MIAHQPPLSSAASTWTSSPPRSGCRAGANPLSGKGFTTSPGGKAGNQACQLVKCGTDASILTRLGNDSFGRQLLEHLTSHGVDPSLISVDEKEPTGASTVFVAEGDYSSIIVSGAAGKLTAADIESKRAALEAADALVLQLELPARHLNCGGAHCQGQGPLCCPQRVARS